MLRNTPGIPWIWSSCGCGDSWCYDRGSIWWFRGCSDPGVIRSMGLGILGSCHLGCYGSWYPIPNTLPLVYRGYTVYKGCGVCYVILLEYLCYHPLVHGVECVDASGVVRSVPAGRDPMGGWSDGYLDTWYLVLWSWGYSPSSPLLSI